MPTERMYGVPEHDRHERHHQHMEPMPSARQAAVARMPAQCEHQQLEVPQLVNDDVYSAAAPSARAEPADQWGTDQEASNVVVTPVPVSERQPDVAEFAQG